MNGSFNIQWQLYSMTFKYSVRFTFEIQCTSKEHSQRFIVCMYKSWADNEWFIQYPGTAIQQDLNICCKVYFWNTLHLKWVHLKIHRTCVQELQNTSNGLFNIQGQLYCMTLRYADRLIFEIQCISKQHIKRLIVCMYKRYTRQSMIYSIFSITLRYAVRCPFEK